MYVIFSGARKNMGDFLIEDRLCRLIAKVRPDHEVVILPRWRPLNEEEINLIMDDAESKLPKLIKVIDDPIVSSDVVGMKESIVFDRVGTLKIGENMVKTLAWYDNGYNHASRILDVISLYKDLK